MTASNHSELFRKRYGPWALVTGASSGIGLEFARQIADLGLNVILVARRKGRLETLAAELQKKKGVETKVVCVDLSQDNFLPIIQDVIKQEVFKGQGGPKGIEIGLLINNAGFGTTGNFVENNLETEIKMLHVNCRAPLMLAHEYGRQMKDRGKGGIIFSSSIVGFAPVPLWSNYAATKAYDLSLAEGLASELKAHGVDVLALCPGTTEAEFHENAGIQSFHPMRSDVVVRLALSRLGHQKVAVPGILNKLYVLSMKFQPRSWSAMISGKAIAHIRKS